MNQFSNPTLNKGENPSNDSFSQKTSNESNLNTQGDIEKFNTLRDKLFNNPCVAYLNINSLRGNKFHELKEIIKPTLPEIVCIDETKLTPDILTLKLYTMLSISSNYIEHLWNYLGGGKIVYIREGHCRC